MKELSWQKLTARFWAAINDGKEKSLSLSDFTLDGFTNEEGTVAVIPYFFGNRFSHCELEYSSLPKSDLAKNYLREINKRIVNIHTMDR